MASRRPLRRISRARAIAIGVILVFLISISTIVRFYTDLLWYREVGFSSVFFGMIRAQLFLAGIFGLGFFLFALANFIVVGRIMPVYRIAMDPDDSLERYRSVFLPYFRVAAVGGSLLLAVLFALGITPLWQSFVLFRHAVPFGQADPIFHRDIAFYMFKLPVYRAIYGWLFSSITIVTLLIAGTHYLTGGIRAQATSNRVTPQVKAHLSVLVGLLALTRAWGYRLNQYQLLYSPRGVVTGASYTDVHAQFPALQLLVIISIISAVLFLVNIRFRGWVLPVIGVGVWLLVSILAGGVYPFVVQRFKVEPSELQKETPFIQRNIQATRLAYGVDKMKVTDFSPLAGIDTKELQTNIQSIDAIRLWDPDTLKAVYKQRQAIRPYYEFADVDVDRYLIDDRIKQVMVSGREIDLSALGTQTWQNQHMVFTHGHGAVGSETNGSSSEGQPNFLVQGIPASSDQKSLQINQGGIYFGEAMSPGSYSIVNTQQKELDFASQETQKTQYTNYRGAAGVPIKNIFRRAAFAWRFGDFNLLISGLIRPESKVLFNRQVRDRAQMAAPFLKFDGDPYIVVADGGIFWMMDAYTASDMYPYSQRLDFSTQTWLREGSEGPSIDGTYNYLRNSVKVVVDAYNGSMSYYVWDTGDPIIKAWMKAFPALFKDRSEVPVELLAHVRYPEDQFRIQSHVYLRYHMTDVQEFYTKEDLWMVPQNPTELESHSLNNNELQPYFVLMRLPGSDHMEYILILPTNPSGKENMVSLLAARADPAGYGGLVDLRFPRGTPVYGVRQISARINADEHVSPTKSLLNQSGSKAFLGNLLVIPIGNSILYSQPMFVQSSATSSIPELKYVILATSDRIVIQPTLEEAVRTLIEGGPSVTPTQPGGLLTDAQRLQEALAHLQKADQALRNGDLATYQAENEAARNVLENSGSGASPSPSSSPSPAK